MAEGGDEEKGSVRAPAIFISYASQDAEAASRICQALRAAGIEVWLDQSALRGGDLWDQRIRREIRDCTLFMPVISANTASRHEGYFRLEWDLADQRTHMMARDRAFILPVCLDATKESGTDVPDSFHRVQWTRLSDGNTLPQLTARILALLGTPGATVSAAESSRSAAKTGYVAPADSTPIATANSALRRNRLAIAVAAASMLMLAYLAIERFRLARQIPADKPAAVAAAASMPATPAIPERSIAVLPFVDMSEKRDQEYFSDGLTEELIDMLTKVADLRVPARTSSFYFKGKQTTIAAVAKALGVTHVLEGSLRKSGKNLRITAQLIRADNGYHVWSETYDRKLDDIFKLQDEIAAAVVKALRISLHAGENLRDAPVESPDAYTLLLQARFFANRFTRDDVQRSIDYYNQAIRLEPTYAAAWAGLSRVLAALTEMDVLSWQQGREPALHAAERALALGPGLAAAHIAMGKFRFEDWNWVAAEAEFTKARMLDPRDSDAINWIGYIASTRARTTDAIQLFKQAMLLDPLNAGVCSNLAAAYYALGEYADAEQFARRALELEPGAFYSRATLGRLLLERGATDAALAEIRVEPDSNARGYTLAWAFQRLGRQAEADAALAGLESTQAAFNAYGIAAIYAVRRERNQAFSWLYRAFQQHDSQLPGLVADPDFKNLRGDARWTTLLRKMNLAE